MEQLKPQWYASCGVFEIDGDVHKLGKNDLFILPCDGEEAVP